MPEEQKNSLKEKLLAAAKKQCRVRSCPSEGALPVGSSKIGGLPDVPEDFVWPTYEGREDDHDPFKLRPLSFLAQFRVEDVASADEEHLLPPDGLLSFFYEVETQRWGFDPEDAGSARVYWFPGTAALSRAADVPAGIVRGETLLPEMAVGFDTEISLPDIEYLPDEADWDEFQACRAACGCPEEEDEVTKLLGYPDVIQNPMEEECECVTRGLYCGNSEDSRQASPEEQADILAKAGEWRMLFQMGTVATEDYELMFGDAGYIYFWIRREDLLARRFDKAWLILQCY